MTTGAIHVTVRFGEPLRRAIGQYRVGIELPAAASVVDLLASLRRTYPEFAMRFRGDDLGHDHPYRIFVNHKLVAGSECENHELAEGDLVHIVLPVVGGA